MTNNPLSNLSFTNEKYNSWREQLGIKLIDETLDKRSELQSELDAITSYFYCLDKKFNFIFFSNVFLTI